MHMRGPSAEASATLGDQMVAAVSAADFRDDRTGR